MLPTQSERFIIKSQLTSWREFVGILAKTFFPVKWTSDYIIRFMNSICVITMKNSCCLNKTSPPPPFSLIVVRYGCYTQLWPTLNPWSTRQSSLLNVDKVKGGGRSTRCLHRPTTDWKRQGSAKSRTSTSIRSPRLLRHSALSASTCHK